MSEMKTVDEIFGQMPKEQIGTDLVEQFLSMQKDEIEMKADIMKAIKQQSDQFLYLVGMKELNFALDQKSFGSFMNMSASQFLNEEERPVIRMYAEDEKGSFYCLESEVLFNRENGETDYSCELFRTKDGELFRYASMDHWELMK
ncbi:MAG: hypothetical protein U0K57_09150 [Lachnospiraceae bacterium]|nr:hypothetical protein [Lachnospiraceae bacterium]